MANPQPEDGYVKLANEIWNEIIRRDFSKRQKDIILFIWRLSYGCQRKTALIPLLKDFELCGIGQQNIRKELTLLKECKVINWDQTKNLFAVNKDYDQWQITPVRGWDEVKFKELISKNLSERKISASQNEKLKEIKHQGILIFASQNKKCVLLKIRSGGFLKREVKEGSNHCGCRKKGVSKDIIKNRFKDSSCCLGEDPENKKSFEAQIENQSASQDAVPAGDADSNWEAAELDYRKQVTNLYLSRRAKGFDLSSKDEDVIDELIADGVPLSIALAGITKSFDKFKPKYKKDEIKSLSYCASIIYSLHAESQVESTKQEILNNSHEGEECEPEDAGLSEDDVKKMLADMRSKTRG